MIEYVLVTTGLAPVMASRTMIPLFVTVATVSWWPALAGSSDGLVVFSAYPDFMVANLFVAMLLLAAAAEVGVPKVAPEVTEFALPVAPYLRSGGTFVLSLVLAPAMEADTTTVGEVFGAQQASALDLGFSLAWSGIVAGGTLLTGYLRSSVYGFLIELDDGDDLGLRNLFGWFEDAFGFWGALLVIVLPIAALIVAILTVTGLALTKWLMKRAEDRRRRECPGCGAANQAAALNCQRCRRGMPQANTLGFLGFATHDRVHAQPEHRHSLLGFRRCPFCAERLEERSVKQTCSACSTESFGTEADALRYLETCKAGLPRTMLVCFAVGLVPIVGLIPALVYYRVGTISKLRTYLPRSKAIATRWGVRLLNLILICAQPIPLFGALTVPLICWTNFAIYGALFRGEVRKRFGQQPAELGFAPMTEGPA